MPRLVEYEKLTCLQTLSTFIVNKYGSDGAQLSELNGLNSLRGELVNAKTEFQAANLKEKQHLRSLTLCWDQNFLSEANGSDHEIDMLLEELQPHPNLKELCVKGWRGSGGATLVRVGGHAPLNFQNL